MKQFSKDGGTGAEVYPPEAQGSPDDIKNGVQGRGAASRGRNVPEGLEDYQQRQAK